MKINTWYVVLVSFNDGNPIHRAVCFHSHSQNVELFGSYEYIIHKNAKDLPYFEIIEPIKSMNTRRKRKVEHHTPSTLRREGK